MNGVDHSTHEGDDFAIEVDVHGAHVFFEKSHHVQNGWRFGVCVPIR